MSPTVRKRTESSSTRSPGRAGVSDGDRDDRAAAAHHRPAVREVDRRQLQLFARDVLPHVELGPVRDGKRADVLALADPRVVEAPQLGALALRVPLAELVAEGEDPLLGARLLLVAPRAADASIEAELGDRVEQRHRLVLVARRERVREHHPPGPDGVLERADDEPLVQLRRPAVAERDHLRVIVPRVDVKEREREARRAERLLREPQQAHRVLPSREEQGRVRALAGDLTEDVDGLRLQPVEMGERSAGGGGGHGRGTSATGPDERPS